MTLLPRDYQAIALELALLAAGHRFPRLSQVGSAWAHETGSIPTKVELDPPAEKPVRIDIQCDDYSFFLLDLTLCVDGTFRLIEANGSNAALSSSILGKDDRRARHMFLTYKSKVKPRGQVAVVLGYQESLIHIAEFFARAGIFAERVAEHQSTRLCNVDESLGEEDVVVVCDKISQLADHIVADNGRLLFNGRPIVFGCNPNLLPELVRKGTIRRNSDHYSVDASIYQEGICTPLVHDKGTQQDICAGTGIKPLYYDTASNREECLSVLSAFRERKMVAVGKMNAGSGGAGIEFFDPTLSKEVCEERLDALFSSATNKHGNGVATTIFPIRFFEFAEATPYDLYGKGHLWDMRFQCAVYPGYVEITPCVIRLCSEPFEQGRYTRASVVSNLTGRDPETMGRYMRSPAAQRRSQPRSVLDALGLHKQRLDELILSCARWCESAMRYYSR